jgi:hypothetical protein
VLLVPAPIINSLARSSLSSSPYAVLSSYHHAVVRMSRSVAPLRIEGAIELVVAVETNRDKRSLD